MNSHACPLAGHRRASMNCHAVLPWCAIPAVATRVLSEELGMPEYKPQTHATETRLVHLSVLRGHCHQKHTCQTKSKALWSRLWLGKHPSPPSLPPPATPCAISRSPVAPKQICETRQELCCSSVVHRKARCVCKCTHALAGRFPENWGTSHPTRPPDSRCGRHSLLTPDGRCSCFPQRGEDVLAGVLGRTASPEPPCDQVIEVRLHE